MPPTILDNPIAAPGDDYLDRYGYARSLASIITSAPHESSFRLGIYGEWGEGKTSVMRLIERCVKDQAFKTTWIYPWAAATSVELRQLLLRSVAAELGVGQWGFATAEKVERVLERVRTAGAGIDWKVKLADSVFGGTLQHGAQKLSGRQSRNFIARIRDELTRHPLVVFVDDLDRTQARLVPELLLVLRDGLDFPNLFYVVGISPRVLEEALITQNPGFKQQPHRFLEKIIEYPSYLPEVKLETLREFTVRQARELGNAINNDVLVAILPVLSKNPRQIKLLLRYLASLESQLRRFDPDEIDLKRLYLCQILKLEFSEEARRLANDDNLMDEIGSNSLLRRLTESKIEVERKENTYAPDESFAKARFLNLCSALRESGPSPSRYSLREMFTILEQPPVITWRESNIIFEKFHAAAENAKCAILDSWLAQSQNSRSNSVCHLFQQIVKVRESLLSWVVEVDAEDEILERLSKVSSATELLKRLLECQELFRIGGLDTSDWMELFVHLARWSKWRRPEYYLKTRNEELELLKCAAKAVTSDMKNHIFVNLWKLDSHGKRDCSEEFLQEIEVIKNRFSTDLAESVIKRFSRAEGIKVFWGESSFPAEKLIAFDPNSVFHTSEYRKNVIELAALAPTDKVVHENFLVYFEILAYGATQGGSLSYSNCQALLRDQEFTKMIWEAAVARPLNLRTVGSLRERIESLKQILGSKIESFSLPAWFQAMDDKYFGSKLENKK
ncbi:MAG: P-loop NTPase fold protein [Candidatus Binatia bacterium]